LADIKNRKKNIKTNSGDENRRMVSRKSEEGWRMKRDVNFKDFWGRVKSIHTRRRQLRKARAI
jgi:hypothetical protein